MNALVRAVVVTVNVALAFVEPASVTEDGETVQVEPAGTPAHVQVTDLSKPPLGESETVKVAVSPAVTVLLAGLAAAAKSGVVFVGCTDCNACTISNRPLPIPAPIDCACEIACAASV